MLSLSPMLSVIVQASHPQSFKMKRCCMISDLTNKRRKKRCICSIFVAYIFWKFPGTSGTLDPTAPRKRRKPATQGDAKLSQKAIALTVGASQDRSVWTEESMAAAVQHLAKADESESTAQKVQVPNTALIHS